MGTKNEMSLTVTTKEVESRKRINEAVRNNPHKFPDGYFFVLDDTEKKGGGRKFRPP